MVASSYIAGNVLTDGEAWIALNSTLLDADATSIEFKSGFADGDDPAGSGSGGVQNWDQYMDLVAIAYVRAAPEHNSRIALLSINGSSTNADYDTQQHYGNGTAPVAEAVSSNYWFNVLIGDNSTDNAFCVAVTQFFDINSGKFKSFSVEAASEFVTEGQVFMAAGTFLKQDPISSLKFYEDSGQGLKDESRIDLFGVLPSMLTTGTLP